MMMDMKYEDEINDVINFVRFNSMIELSKQIQTKFTKHADVTICALDFLFQNNKRFDWGPRRYVRFRDKPSDAIVVI